MRCGVESIAVVDVDLPEEHVLDVVHEKRVQSAMGSARTTMKMIGEKKEKLKNFTQVRD